MFKSARAYSLTFAAALCQGYLLSAATRSFLPNLVLIIVFWWSVQASSRLEAVALGLWGGFWLDVISNTAFGWHMVWFGLFSLSIHWLKTSGWHTERPTFWISSLTGGSLVYNLSLWLSLTFGAGWQRPWIWAGQWAVEAAATVLIGYLAGGYLKARLGAR